MAKENFNVHSKETYTQKDNKIAKDKSTSLIILSLNCPLFLCPTLFLQTIQIQ